jgi:hypothetical protein
VGARLVGRGSCRGSSGRLYRARRGGERATAGSNGLQCHGGPAVLITLRGRGFDQEKWKEIKRVE